MQRRGYGDKRVRVAVAIDKDKGSQFALKWAIEQILRKGQSVTLVHVKQKASSIPTPLGNHVSISDVNEDVARAYKQQVDNQAMEMFLPFRCFCTRKDVQCNEVVLEDTDIAKAIVDFVTASSIEILVVGAATKGGLMRRFNKTTDVPSSVSKAAPDFCSVYVISKGKIASVRSATRPAPNPPPSPTGSPIHKSQSNLTPDPTEALPKNNRTTRAPERSPFGTRNLNDNEIKSPFTRGKTSYSEPTMLETDLSFVSSGRPSTERFYPHLYDNVDSEMDPRLPNASDMNSRLSSSSEMNSRLSSSSDMNMTIRLSNVSEMDNGSLASFGGRSPELSHSFEQSPSSSESGMFSWASQSTSQEDVESEMRRLKLELKQTMDMYSTACKEALVAKQKAKELHRWKMEDELRLEEARLAEEAALALAEREKAKAKAALDAAEASQRIAELEARKRISAEMMAMERKKMLDNLKNSDIRYRKYTIEEIEAATDLFSDSRKIGEGGYGPVYKCHLDHTPVAIKVLRPDAAQGRSQFQQEVEVLSCIRHPNMVLLVGACPEYGCLVYEYMANGSLEDRLFRKGNTPVLPWQLRFRIAAEIGTGLLFLHQTKPEPLVHRDLKPGNILLDHNFVSKISDVGLARLVPPSVADSVTQYRMTSTAGTFCYIDPEYQQSGMLGTKSDIYSLGIMLLQVITAKPPMGLTHFVERAIEKGTFADVLDPAVPDWPLQETLNFAKLALRCAELRRKDRPDLGNVILPELNRWRKLAEENMSTAMLGSRKAMLASPMKGNASTVQEVISNPQLPLSGYNSATYLSIGSSITERM